MSGHDVSKAITLVQSCRTLHSLQRVLVAILTKHVGLSEDYRFMKAQIPRKVVAKIAFQAAYLQSMQTILAVAIAAMTDTPIRYPSLDGYPNLKEFFSYALEGGEIFESMFKIAALLRFSVLAE